MKKFLIIFLIIFLSSCSININISQKYLNCNNIKIKSILHRKIQNKIFQNQLKYFTFKYFIPLHKTYNYCDEMVQIYEGKNSIGWIRFYVIKTDDNKFFVKVFKKLITEKIN